MGRIFREDPIRMNLDDVKTQTLRLHKRPLKVGRVYRINRNWFEFTDIHIRITKRHRQRLGDVTPEEALKEGGYTFEEYKEVWRRINGSWDPSIVVWVYEFRLLP